MMENTTKIKKLRTSLNDGLNALDGNVSNFRAHRETYETIYCQDDNPEHIEITIEISIYIHKSFRKKYPGKPVLSVRTFPNIESEIKKTSCNSPYVCIYTFFNKKAIIRR